MVIGPRVNPINLFNLVDILRDYKINIIHLTPEILNSLNKIYENKNLVKSDTKYSSNLDS